MNHIIKNLLCLLDILQVLKMSDYFIGVTTLCIFIIFGIFLKALNVNMKHLCHSSHLQDKRSISSSDPGFLDLEVAQSQVTDI